MTELVKTRAVCLAIRPWSRTSHIVTWLTPTGRVVTAAKGAVRPKSFLLGQYDLNYSAEIVYYQRAHGEVHALREAAPLAMREALREDWRALALAGYCRALMAELAPTGEEGGAWFDLLERTLDALLSPDASLLAQLIRFELAVLQLAGSLPDFSGYDRKREWSLFPIEAGAFVDTPAGRGLRVSRAVAAYLAAPEKSASELVLLDAARVIGVFYQFHMDTAVEIRRSVLKAISSPKQ